MLNTLLRIGLGIACAYLGIMVIIQPKFYHELARQTIDVSGFNWPLGGALIACGILLIYFELEKYKR